MAFARRDGKAMQIWIHNFGRQSTNQLTLGDTDSSNPKWMPDGKYLIFHRPDGVYTVAAEGSGKP